MCKQFNGVDIPDDIRVVEYKQYNDTPSLMDHWYEIYHLVPFLFWRRWKPIQQWGYHGNFPVLENKRFYEHKDIIHYIKNYKETPPNTTVRKVVG